MLVGDFTVFDQGGAEPVTGFVFHGEGDAEAVGMHSRVIAEPFDVVGIRLFEAVFPLNDAAGNRTFVHKGLTRLRPNHHVFADIFFAAPLDLFDAHFDGNLRNIG